LYGSGNVIVTNSNFTESGGSGYAITGLQNINITGCMFSNNTQSSSIILHNIINSPGDFGVYVTDSKFHNCSRAIYSQANARVIGDVIYSSDSVTLTNCTIMNSAADIGHGGAVYSEGMISVLNCTIINSYVTAYYYGGAIYGREVHISNSTLMGNGATTGGGAVYSIDTVTIINSRFRDCSVSTGNGGAIYSTSDITLINSAIHDCSALNGKGGAIFSASSQSYGTTVRLFNSIFSNNSATSGGVLYADGLYHYDMQFSDSMTCLHLTKHWAASLVAE
jgi:predicted outer membrane repeat protein